MLTLEELRDRIHTQGLSRRDKLLLILLVDPDVPKPTTQVREMALTSGIREVRKWNISDVLGAAKGFTIRLNEGWLLTQQGQDYLIQKNLVAPRNVTVQNILADLRQHAVALRNDDTRNFVEEAIKCLEVQAYRASIVLSWIGAISVLYSFVVQHHLTIFNTEAKRHDPKWRDAKIEDDLARMKESEFLNTLERLSIVGKSAKQELQNCLQLRNGCGHPNSLVVRERIAVAHVETLILNVFSKF